MGVHKKDENPIHGTIFNNPSSYNYEEKWFPSFKQKSVPDAVHMKIFISAETIFFLKLSCKPFFRKHKLFCLFNVLLGEFFI